MTFFRFRTFRTSYYFPHMTEDMKFMYGLYAVYGGKLSRLYWWLFRNSKMVRWMNRVESATVEFPIDRIVELEGKKSLMAINLGTPGIEQKISILGYHQQKKEKFFAKYSEKKAAMKLTKNEIAVYKMLESTGLTPTLFDAKVSEEFVWMKTSCVEGSHYPTMELTQEIVDLALELSKHHLHNETSNAKDLQTCLSHGDFCPWNMLVKDGKIKLIDWEMAADRPLGYDIFKYVCQISLLFTPEKPLIETIKENQTLINNYFTQCGIENWDAYRNEFLKVFSKNAK